ncbi:Iron dicitrate transport regulator FecR [Planctomycetales bacterium 10988]|nr:Iron dicitrate transport regulator FecR [Planctomycetales bacterium 10988]
MSQARFEELLSLLLDDEVSGEQLDELVAMASQNPYQLQLLRTHLQLSDRLSQYEEELRSEERFLQSLTTRTQASQESISFIDQVLSSAKNVSAKPEKKEVRWEDTSSKSSWRGLAGWVIAAAALLALAGMLAKDIRFEHFPENESPMASEERDGGVAVLTRVVNLQGAENGLWRVGETVPPSALKWKSGLIQLEFYCGATVVVEGPASLEILDESRVLCHSGRLRARVPEPARGFSVLAPTVELVDLGTEFGMEIKDSGATEVHVFDGKVELYDAESNRDQQTRRELNAGDALTVAQDGASNKISPREEDFVTPNRLDSLTDARRQEQWQKWRTFRNDLEHDSRIVAYFPFEKDSTRDRILTGYAAGGRQLEGAIVGCEWAEGRWPGKSCLDFKRPGDRVRVQIPGEFPSLTYSTWLRVDGLDREFNSLLLPDGFSINRPHWQIRRDGPLILGLRHTQTVNYDYQTDSIFNLFRLGQWVHLATVYDSDQRRITHYVNGQIATREPLKNAAEGLLSVGDATIGNWSSPPTRFRSHIRVRNLNGRMDELIIFNQALTDTEIQHIYEVGRP